MLDLTTLSDVDLRGGLFETLVARLDARADEDPSMAVVNRMPTVFSLTRRRSVFTVSHGIGVRLLRGELKGTDRRDKTRAFNVDRATVRSRLIVTPDGVEGTPDEIVNWIVEMFVESTGPRPHTRPTAAAPDRKANAPEPRARRTDPQGAPARTYQLLLETARRELDRAEVLPASSRYFLISAGVLIATTVEAFFNDLGSQTIPSWSQLQRLDPREKAEVLSVALFHDKVNWADRPFQSVAAALGFRRALAHAHAETLQLDFPVSVDRRDAEVPRTRRTVWQEHCDLVTIQQWIADVRVLIERFSGQAG